MKDKLHRAIRNELRRNLKSGRGCGIYPKRVAYYAGTSPVRVRYWVNRSNEYLAKFGKRIEYFYPKG